MSQNNIGGMHTKKELQNGNPIKKNNKNKMINAYLLANTYSKDINQILNDTDKLQDITSVAIISGDRDIIVKTKVKSLEQLMNITEKIRSIDGIKEVVTHIVEKEINK
jgi:DNA-binding Lrp family transcriptional regulator